MVYLQADQGMAERATDESVVAVLTDKPQKFDAIIAAVCGPKPRGRRYYPTRASNKVNRVLQRLKSAGVVKYLKKADGGPGWVKS